MVSTSLSTSWESWQQIANGTLEIEDNLPISRFSFFGDNIWSFADPDKPRTLNKPTHMLVVNWQEYKEKLTPDILRSVKVLGFFLVHYPAVISSNRRVAKDGLAPTYCCQLIKVALTFLSEVCSQASLEIGESVRDSYIQTMYDVTLLDIQRAFIHWNTPSLVEQLQKVLCAFTSPLLHKYLPKSLLGESSLKWYAHDIETLNLPIRKKVESGQSDMYRDKPLPDDLFEFMVRVSTNDILSFLIQLGRAACAPVNNIGNHEMFSIFKGSFNEAYEEYLLISTERYIGAKVDEITGRNIRFRDSTRTQDFRVKFGVTVGCVRSVIERVQSAAKYLLLQFTGVRYSEAALLRKGCVELLPSGDYIVKGTVSKGHSINLLSGLDCWVACPIVRDAVSVLDELTRFTQCEYLFAASKYSAVRNVDKSVSTHAMNVMLTVYLYNIDTDRKYSLAKTSNKAYHNAVKAPYRISTHRLRHTIALHMSRAGVGIPYISLHLKHVYQAHKRFQSVQDVTLNYGGIGNDIFHNAVGIRQANRELTDSIYHPQAPVAGPGAEEFKKNRTHYFAGMLAAGWEQEEILEHLSARGLPLTDVGLGYCKGRREFEENGSKKLPPCLGQLKCNPNQCKNAVIPKSKVSMWIQVYKENRRRADDPLMAHARPECLRFMEEARDVLGTLGINISEL